MELRFRLPNITTISFQTTLLLLAGVVIFFIALLKSKTAADFFFDPLLFGYTIFVTVFQLSRLLGAMLYNHSLNHVLSEGHLVSDLESDILETPDPNYEPTISFVVPCKNEESSIAKTVEKCFQSEYPKEKVEVIVINDGSTDNTGSILRSLIPKYPNLTLIDWNVNRGKRHGMAAGFRAAKNEIVIQLDSDSYIEPSTFREIIEPFKRPSIGAVCAHADPTNPDENILTKMQAAYYFVSFRILKAAESTFLSVFCCSGCCSAYRKSIILPILDEWLNEKFLGQPVTWGDDRSLTNWVLKKGYKTIYSDKVKSFTTVPNKLRIFIKQQVRWKKGWFVNSIFASRFIFKRDWFVSLSYFFPLIVLTLLTPFIATRALVYNPLVHQASPFFYLTGIMLVACLFTLYYRWLSPDNRYWPYVFVWSALNLLILSFILFYALLTIQNRKWGTR